MLPRQEWESMYPLNKFYNKILQLKRDSVTYGSQSFISVLITVGCFCYDISYTKYWFLACQVLHHRRTFYARFIISEEPDGYVGVPAIGSCVPDDLFQDISTICYRSPPYSLSPSSASSLWLKRILTDCLLSHSEFCKYIIIEQSAGVIYREGYALTIRWRADNHFDWWKFCGAVLITMAKQRL